MLAYVLMSKYGHHLPLYRQAEIYARKGVELDRSTLAAWVGATSELLAPLVAALREHVMAARKLHADDTPVPEQLHKWMEKAVRQLSPRSETTGAIRYSRG